MTRLIQTMKNDVTVQVRNNLYSIGIGVGILTAVILAQLLNANQVGFAVPVIVLFVVGGSTLLYVAGMIIFEKDEGTINSLIVTPLKTNEYLGSKIATLTALGTIESLIMVYGAMFIINRGTEVAFPNIAVLILGIVTMGVMYTLLGIILVVRYDKITDFLVPVIIIASIAQSPFVYFMGITDNPLFLLIPTSAPTMLMQGAFMSLTMLEWVYALTYSAALIVGMSIWAYRAFQTHIIMKVG